MATHLMLCILVLVLACGPLGRGCAQAAQFSPSRNQIPLGSGSGASYVFRDATAADIDDIVTVIIDAFDPSEYMQYVNLPVEPGYRRECMRRSLVRELPNINPNRTFAKVIAVPDPGRGERVVALGLWNLITPQHSISDPEVAGGFWPSALWSSAPSPRSSFETEPQPSSPPFMGSNKEFNCSARLDTNLTRDNDALEHMDAAKKEYIDDVYDHYVLLNLLATHPDWDGNGFGAAHCNWGMELARKKGQDVALIATPAGHPLYKSLGFEDINNITIERLDGQGVVWFEVMTWKAE